MPVRSLNSSVIKWPRRKEVEKAFKKWVTGLIDERNDVIRVGYFGSYARGNWGVGSDLDIIVILEETNEPFERRGVNFNTSDIPVPTELLVYSQDEWNKMKSEKRDFYRHISDEIIWINR